VFVLIVSGTATAAPWKPTTPGARDLMKRGKAAYERGEHLAAASMFVDAWKQERALLAAFNAAQSYRLAGEYKRAIEFYDLILADSAITKTEREDVQRRRQIAEWFLLAEVNAAAGKREDARDYYRRLLDVRDLSPSDREKVVDAIEDLARAAAEPAPSPDPTPPPVTSPSSASSPPASLAPDDAPPSAARPSRWSDTVALGLTGAGLVGVGVGLGYVVHASDLDDQAAGELIQVRKQALLADADHAQTIGLVALGTGGAFLLAGAIKLAIPPDAPQPSLATLQPLHGGALVIVGGSF
jgi:tetratricopeptide (TPR) repeat protein